MTCRHVSAVHPQSTDLPVPNPNSSLRGPGPYPTLPTPGTGQSPPASRSTHTTQCQARPSFCCSLEHRTGYATSPCWVIIPPLLVLQPVLHIGVIHEPHDSGIDRSVLHQHHGVGRGFSEEKVFSVLLVDHDNIFHFW